jgi:hypothetical protein
LLYERRRRVGSARREAQPAPAGVRGGGEPDRITLATALTVGAAVREVAEHQTLRFILDRYEPGACGSEYTRTEEYDATEEAESLLGWAAG